LERRLAYLNSGGSFEVIATASLLFNWAAFEKYRQFAILLKPECFCQQGTLLNYGIPPDRFKRNGVGLKI
jgi:hypothetical protein